MHSNAECRSQSQSANPPTLHVTACAAPCLPAGCKGSCSDELPPVVEKQGFKGALTMPRQLNYEPLTKTLRAYPVKDVEKLRGQQVRRLC